MHQSIQVGFPVFSLEFTPNKPRLLVGGGGGPNKSGIKNAILYLSVNERAVDADKITELKLSNEEDGCMSITIHPKTKTFVAGISESKSQQDQGINNNCRIFRVANEQIEFKTAVQTVSEAKSTDFQKTCKFNPEGTLLLAGCTDGKLSILKYPELTTHLQAIDHKAEVLHCDWDPLGKMFISVSHSNCYVHNVDNGETIWSIEKPLIQKTEPCEFRACAFGRNTSANHVFLIINAKSRKAAYLSKWRVGNKATGQPWTMVRSKLIARKPVTAFAISHDGHFLAIGTADLTLTLLAATTFAPVMKVSNIHGFPLTCIAFSPSDDIVATGSADGTFAICKVSTSKKGGILTWFFLILLLVALFGIFLFLLGMNDEQDL